MNTKKYIYIMCLSLILFGGLLYFDLILTFIITKKVTIIYYVKQVARFVFPKYIWRILSCFL